MVPDEQAYPGLFFMLGVERLDCSNEQDMEVAGNLAMWGNIEFLTSFMSSPTSSSLMT